MVEQDKRGGWREGGLGREIEGGENREGSIRYGENMQVVQRFRELYKNM